MGSKDTFEAMEKTHQVYFPLFSKICLESDFPRPIQQMIEDFVIGRLGKKKGVRAFVFNQMYKLAGGDENISMLLAAVELHLAWMYCLNVGADEKAGYDTEKKIIIAFETAEVVHELALRVVHEIHSSDSLKEEIKKIFLKTRTSFLEGQIQDTIINLYSNRGKRPVEVIDEIERLPDSAVFNKYGIPKNLIVSYVHQLPDIPIKDFTLERTYKVNAVMFENFGKIVGLVLDLDDNKSKSLMGYGKYLGINMQIINDIQDYSLDLIETSGKEVTREKNKDDVFADIRKGLITWPIKLALEIDPNLDSLFRNKLGNGGLSYDELENIRELLVKNGAIKKSILEAAYYSKLANQAIKDFPDSESKRYLLEESASIAKFSKYTHVLEKKYKITLKPTHSSIDRRMKLAAS